MRRGLLTVNVRLCLLRRCEHAGRLANILCALASPRDVSGVLGSEDVDRDAIHNEVPVFHLRRLGPCVGVLTQHALFLNYVNDWSQRFLHHGYYRVWSCLKYDYFVHRDHFRQW